MSGGNSYFNLGFSGPTLWPLFGNIFSGGGNYETGFTDWVLAWSPEVEEWQVVGNMLAARYIRCICWHLPQSVSQLVCRFSHQLLLNISVQHLTSLPMQCYGCCRGCVEEFDSSNILGFFSSNLGWDELTRSNMLGIQNIKEGLN